MYSGTLIKVDISISSKSDYIINEFHSINLFILICFRYVLIMDDIEAQISIFELNITPDYFTNILELRDTWLAFTIILGVLFLILILLFLALRRRIIIAIKMIEQGSKAVGQMCSSLIFPIIPFIFHAIFAMLFVAIAMYLSSYGQQEYQIFFEHGGLGKFGKIVVYFHFTIVTTKK